MKLHQLALGILLAGAALPSLAVGRLVDVAVLDRDTGAVLPAHYHQGEYWVAGSPGARYAIALRNRLGQKILAVTSVDGVNVLDGATAGWDQTGYVLSSLRRYQITGWRKSNSEVAAFTFSTADASYAGRTGRPGNIGVIGVAVFREKLPQSQPRLHEPLTPRHEDNAARRDDERASVPAPPLAPSALEANPARSLADSTAEKGTGPSRESESAQDLSTSRAKSLAQAPAPRLGTAHGERESSWVSHTAFERLHDRPDEVIRIRYDSRENLIAAGVIRVPAPHRPQVDPFPRSEQAVYVPDPPPLRH